jgi:hypothetical protein
MKRLMYSLLTLWFIGVFFLAGCGAAPRMAEQSAPNVGAIAPVEAPIADSDGSAKGEIASPPSQNTERIIIKNGDMTLVVSDPPASMEKIKTLAETLGGFVVTANLSQRTLDNGVVVPQAQVTIRVPAEKFDEAIKQIRQESKQLPLSENSNSQDVTFEYTDLQSRLRNLEKTQAQLNSFLEATTNTEEALSVYNELASVGEQIEVIKGQIQYYEQSAALSAISVQLLANESIQPLTIGSWKPVGTAKSAIQALIGFIKGFTSFLIYLLLLIIPVLLVLFIVFVLPVFLIVRFFKRRKQKQAIKKGPPANPEV